MNIKTATIFLFLLMGFIYPQDKRHAFVLVTVGIAQDAGYPQAGCTRSCCAPAWKNPALRKYVSCLALVDLTAKQYWLFDATPDIKFQMHDLEDRYPGIQLAGVLLTHAHIGHYTGLVNFGRECMNTNALPVYAMPRMDSFLRNNGPWNQLMQLHNIRIEKLENHQPVKLSAYLSVMPRKVPHRDEFSETVGFEIAVNGKRILYIPDIDKWGRMQEPVSDLLKGVDLAFVDGTFYGAGELSGRNMQEVPHPLVEESTALFAYLPPERRKNIRFIHFNHTNPLLQENSAAYRKLVSAGFGVARQGEAIIL